MNMQFKCEKCGKWITSNSLTTKDKISFLSTIKQLFGGSSDSYLEWAFECDYCGHKWVIKGKVEEQADE